MRLSFTFLATTLASLAATLVVAVIPAPAFADGPSIRRIEVEPGSLANIRDPMAFSRVEGPESVNRVFQGTGSAATCRINGGGEGVSANIGRVRGENAIADSIQDLNGLRSALDRVQSFGEIRVDRAYSVSQLRDQSGFFNRILEERLDYVKFKVLSPSEIKEFALPNSWVFRWVGLSTFDLIDPTTGKGVRTQGDPQQYKITPNGVESALYRDWDSTCQIYKLPPGLGQKFPTIVLAFSDGIGGTSRNQGDATSLYVLSEKLWYYVDGITSGKLTGCASEGSKYLALGPVVRPALARATHQTWLPDRGEMGLNPSDAYDPIQLFQDVHYVGADSVGKLEKEYREVEESFTQALSLRGAPLPQAGADALAVEKIKTIKADASLGRANTEERLKLSNQVAAMQQRLLVIRDLIGRPGIAPREVKAKEAEAFELIKSIKELIERANTLGATTDAP